MWTRFAEVFRMIKIEHTLFALPFALVGVWFAAGGWPGWRLLILVVLAMFFVRSAAMAFNRLADADIDAQNPRTKDRSIPAGRLSRTFVAVYVAVHAAAFMAVTWFINPLAFRLSPLALAVVLGYSYTKRFTSMSHVVLGLGLAMAPAGGWIAVRGSLDAAPVWLALAVLFWVAGFDILYALQDREFDRRLGLQSIPARLGVRWSLRLARVLHAGTVITLMLFAWQVGGGVWFGAGVAMSALLLLVEHRLLSPEDLSRLDAAFFTVNSFLSVILLGFTVMDFIVR